MKDIALNITIDRIKAQLDLSSIIMQDVDLRRKGKEYVGRCPFHDEKTGSFFVNDEKGSYYCFGCGASGDIFSYLINKRGINFTQALEYLASMAGVELTQRQVNPKILKLYEILEYACSFFEESLAKNETVNEYCKKRGIDSKSSKYFRLGYSQTDSLPLFNYLKSKNFSLSDLLSSGLFFKASGKIISKFQNRLMFPICDNRGKVIAFGGRSLSNEVMPKYLNSAESDIFLKKSTLYNFHNAVKSANKVNNLIIVEGYIDVLMMYKYGYPQCIASMGTSFTAEHLKKIFKYSNEPIVCFDGDQAGYSSMIKLATLSFSQLSQNKTLKFVKLPDGYDPDSFLEHFGKTKMEDQLNNAQYLIDFIWKHFENEYYNIESKIPEHIAKWKNDIWAVVKQIEDPSIRNSYQKIYNDRIFSLLSRKKIHTQPPAKKIEFDNKKSLIRESFLLYALLKIEDALPERMERLSLADFETQELDDLKNDIVNGTGALNDQQQLSIRRLEANASFLCDFETESQENILILWDEVFNMWFVQKNQKEDIKQAKEEYSTSLDQKKWERLKALKMKTLKHK